MLRENGTTRLNVVPNPSAPQSDPFLQAVKNAAAADFAVLGEIGRGAAGVIIYLAREASTRRLVALRLQREGTQPDEFTLEVVRHLDDSMPAPDSKCFKCGKSVAGWSRFCGYCGADLSGAAPASDDAVDRAVMLEAVKGAVSGQYDVYGEMSRNEGGGAVYFACDIVTNKIVALRLQREAGGEEFSLGLTTALKPIARSLGVRSAPTQAHTPASRAPQPPAPPDRAAPAPASPPRAPKPPAAPPPLPLAAGLSTGAKAAIAGIAAVALVAIVVIFTLPRSPAASVPVAPAPAPAVVVDTTPAVPSPTVATTGPAVATPSVKEPAPVPAPAPAPPREATVRVSGLPAGAEVRVDGRIRVGRSLSMPAGPHVLSIAVDGYQPRSDTLRLGAGETVTWSPALVAVAHVADAKPKPAIPAGATCAGSIKDEKWTEAYESCMREALAGSASARRDLGTLYERGKGISRSDESAARWYESAASGGDAQAMYLTGRAYERGRGVKKNQATAVQWYTRAGNAGDVDAQMVLGEACEKGHLDLKKDKTAALTWYTKAAAQGNKDAANKVKDLSR